MDLAFEEFSPATYEDWRREAEASLKGAPFDKKLVSRTFEGIDLQPIYNASDVETLPHLRSFPGFSPFVRGPEAAGYRQWPWHIAQHISQGSSRDFNSVALHELANGQTALRLTLDRASRAGLDPDQAAPGDVGFCGLSIAHASDMERLIDGVNLEDTAVFLQGGSAGLVFLAMFASVARRRRATLEHIIGAIEQDPISELASDGRLPVSLEHAFDDAAHVTRWAAQRMPGVQTLMASGLPFHDAGATAVQELGAALASGVYTLRQMEARGLQVDAVATRIRVALAMDSDFFMSIAKLRAARLLWARIVAASGGNERSRRMRIHARTALFNKTRLDPYVNMLRVTSEAFAAVLGGCESLQTGAFDEVIRPADEFSRRIARNTQIILREECHMDRVLDPGGGSWYLEHLTDELARKAWEFFRTTERHGGIAAALESGWLQDQIEEVAAKKAEAAALRRLRQIGVNYYANPSEKTLDPGDWALEKLQKRRAAEIAELRTEDDQEAQTAILDELARIMNRADSTPDDLMELVIDAAGHGASLGELSRALRANSGSPEQVRPLRPRRLSEPFEELRAASDRAASAGTRPRVLLLTMGPLKQHKARADFTTGFFEAGGFEMAFAGRLDSAQAAADAALADPANVVVICSTDETYPELVPPIASAIKAKTPARKVLVAGLPPDELIETFRTAGVDDFVHLRANCAALLRNLLTQLGTLS